MPLAANGQTTDRRFSNCLGRCVVCFALLRKAKTLHCGHSICTACASKLASGNAGNCPLPGPTCRGLQQLVMFDGGKRIEYPRDIPLSNNLLLEKYVEKLFPREEEADKIKLEANSLLKAGCTGDAVACYDRAIAVSPDSHTLHGNKAQALLQLQDWAGALAAADASAARVPRWPKGALPARRGAGGPRRTASGGVRGGVRAVPRP